MILQSLLFYGAAVYGGIEESLSQNAADILFERLNARAGELEIRFNNRWKALDDCVSELNSRYSDYEEEHGDMALVGQTRLQIDFLKDSADTLVDTLRYCETNGIFLILNDSAERLSTFPKGGVDLYGLGIRDMDQDSSSSGRDDLLLERAPSSIIDSMGCPLDSWWEAKYHFTGVSMANYYYAPLNAAWNGLSDNGYDLAYFSNAHRISDSDPEVVSYSIPLMSESGYPYAVLGIELTKKYLASLLPSAELGATDKCCYILAMYNQVTGKYEPLAASGVLFNRCFSMDSSIERGQDASTGGSQVTGRDGSELYSVARKLAVYNNNSPFELRRLVLMAAVESDYLFAYIGQIKKTLMAVSFISLLMGVTGLLFVSRRFAAPITALARRVRGMDDYTIDTGLGRLGITEIDQLVDSIEELNLNVSRNSARTEFFSRMSHDMRTPMNAIISFSSPEMLENADETVKDDYMQKIHDSGEYLLGLINEVLDMTKIESSKMELNTVMTQASQLFDVIIPIIRELAKKKHISFNSDINIAPNLSVMVDTQHLEQVIMNLLSNAVKFTPNGGLVELRARMLGSGSSQTCRIVVSDTGIGMSKKFMETMYAPFQQENSNLGGSGLGLSIAKKLVQLMDGTISCISSPGSGTTFTVTVPLPPAEFVATPPQQMIQSMPADAPAFIGKRVLVCEDNTLNAVIIRRLLERVGLEVTVVENGKLGVDTFNNSPPGTFNAILMDIRMPIMDGLSATRAIRALPRDDAAAIPIFAMTADAFVEDQQSSLAAGMNVHLSKPINTTKLYETLKNYLG